MKTFDSFIETFVEEAKTHPLSSMHSIAENHLENVKNETFKDFKICSKHEAMEEISEKETFDKSISASSSSLSKDNYENYTGIISTT